MQQAVNRYYETQVNTAKPEELTMMLYNGCLRFLKQAKASMESNDNINKNVMITKSINIIDELHSTLDMRYELSNQLASLYIYFKERLVYSSIHGDTSVLVEVIEMVTELRDTWLEVVKTVKQR